MNRPRRGSPASKRTQAQRREEAERRLVAAAADIIADRGVDEVTLAEVGAAAGYGRGLAAHYFGNKKGLVEATARYVSESFGSRLAMKPSFPPGLEALLELVDNYLSVGPGTRKHALALQAVIAESLTEPSLRPAIADLNARSIARLTRMIRAGIRNGEIRRSVDPRQQAVILLGTLRSLVAMWLIDRDKAAFNAVRRAMVDSLRRGLQA